MKPKVSLFLISYVQRPNDNEEGLLEYLEDIIGSAKYVPIIETKEIEVEKLSDSRGEVLNRVKVIESRRNYVQIVEKERNTLEAGKKEADLFLSKERELAREQGLLYQYYMHENDNAFEKVKKQNQKNR